MSALLNGAAGQLLVHLESDGSYLVYIGDECWLASGPTFFRADGQLYSTDNGSLKQIDKPRSMSGKDTLGCWHGESLSYLAGGAKVSVSVRVYDDAGGGKIAVFTQVGGYSPVQCVCAVTPL